jgi:hypothetical protein
LANENTASSVTLYAINPTTGAVSGTWTFNPGGNRMGADQH